MSNEVMNGHVLARRDSIREKAKLGDERAERQRDDGSNSAIDTLLARWGRWSIRCESGALGFASSCILGGGSSGDSYDAAIPRGVVDQDMAAVDCAIRKLPGVLREVVMQVYKFGAGWSARKNADALGIERKSMTQYLISAQRQIALDINAASHQNPLQSANGGSSPERIKPVTA